jgi:hypothetical protein
LKLTKKETLELQEIEKSMTLLRAEGLSIELVQLGIERSRLLDKQYSERGLNE